MFRLPHGQSQMCIAGSGLGKSSGAPQAGQRASVVDTSARSSCSHRQWVHRVRAVGRYSALGLGRVAAVGRGVGAVSISTMAPRGLGDSSRRRVGCVPRDHRHDGLPPNLPPPDHVPTNSSGPCPTPGLQSPRRHLHTSPSPRPVWALGARLGTGPWFVERSSADTRGQGRVHPRSRLIDVGVVGLPPRVDRFLRCPAKRSWPRDLSTQPNITADNGPKGLKDSCPSLGCPRAHRRDVSRRQQCFPRDGRHATCRRAQALASDPSSASGLVLPPGRTQALAVRPEPPGLFGAPDHEPPRSGSAELRRSSHR